MLVLLLLLALYLLTLSVYTVQSGASSRAKNGGAYFSVVTGSIHNPIAVPEPCEVTEP